MRKSIKKIHALENQNEYLQGHLEKLRTQIAELTEAGSQLHEAHIAIMIMTALLYGKQEDGMYKLVLPPFDIKDQLAAYEWMADKDVEGNKTFTVRKKEDPEK